MPLPCVGELKHSVGELKHSAWVGCSTLEFMQFKVRAASLIFGLGMTQVTLYFLTPHFNSICIFNVC